MGTISIREAQSNYRWYLDQVVNLKPEVPNFFRTFFKDKVTAAYGTQFEIVRSGRTVYDDIDINGEPNVNRKDKSTTKLFVPPYYAEGTVTDAIQAFIRQVGQSGYISEDAFFDALEPHAEELNKILEGFDRTEELLCSQALIYGLLTLKNGTTIDYKRKGGSKIAYDAANDFGIDTVNPAVICQTLGDFLTTEGLIGSGNVINLLFGNDAWTKFENNPFVKDKINFRRASDIQLVTGVQSVIGAVSKGTASFGTYNFNLWCYNAKYKSNTTGEDTLYMPTDMLIALPTEQNNVMFYGGVPEWEGDPYQSNMIGVKKGKRVSYKYKDIRAVTLEEGYKMRPLPICKEVDKVAYAIVTNSNQEVG